MPTSSGGFHNSSTISHVPVLAWAAPNLKQSLISDAQAGVNTIKHSSSSRDKALPLAHNGLNARPSGPSYLTQDQGAKHIAQVGLGNDDQGIEDDFSTWRELLWPELDKLLQDENETGASTPYTAGIPEYRVVFVKPEEVPYLDKSLSFANDHAIHDIQHPCRANVAVRRELHTSASDRSYIHLEFDIDGTGEHYISLSLAYFENMQDAYTNYISLCSFHWILTIINVEMEINFLLDPLGHRIHDQDWKYVVNMLYA